MQSRAAVGGVTKIRPTDQAAASTVFGDGHDKIQGSCGPRGIAGKRDAVEQCFVLCFLSASCRCALLAGLLAALVACFAGLLGRLPRSVLRMVQVSASSGLGDQSFMILMLSCVVVAVAGVLGILLVFSPWFVGGRCLSTYLRTHRRLNHETLVYET